MQCILFENKKHKDNINTSANANSALKEKTNKLEVPNIKLIKNNNKIMNEINRKPENIDKLNNNKMKIIINLKLK